MQCSEEIEDSADICTFCGAARGGGVTSGTDTAKNTNKAVAVIIAAAAVIILIVLVNLLFGSGYVKKPVDNMVKAMETGKGKNICIRQCLNFFN